MSTNELPEVIREDSRIGKRARSANGFEGVVTMIFRFPDGFELFEIKKGAISEGGVSQEDITFLED